MSLPLSIPLGIVPRLDPLFQEIVRRAIDGTIVPVFVDYANQRVIIGGTTASAVPAKFEVATGSIKVVTAGQGIILPRQDGGRYYLVNVDNTGGLVAAPL